MPDKKCPRCKRWYSETATICDCGYELPSATVRREWVSSRPKGRKVPLDRAFLAGALATYAMAAVIFLVVPAFLHNTQPPLPRHFVFLWIAWGAFYTLLLARDLWLRNRYRTLLPPESPTAQARIIGRGTRKVMGEYGQGILCELVIRFHPAQAAGAPETLTLSAHVSPRTYTILMDRDTVTITYSRQAPRIVLIPDEQ